MHPYYNAQDDIDGDFSDTEESFPNTPRSSAYHDDGISSYSQRSTNVGSYKTPYEDGHTNIANRPKMPEPLYSEPPPFNDVSDELRHHASRQDLPRASRMSQPQPRPHSMDRGFIESEAGYATIGEVRRARSAERSSAPAPRR